MIAVIYRNAINDVRDMRAAISHDGGNTYELGIIDNNNWIIESCPSSGGEGVIIGDSLVSVFMNGVNGNKCFVSTLNINTLQPGFEKPLLIYPMALLKIIPRLWPVAIPLQQFGNRLLRDTGTYCFPIHSPVLPVWVQ